MSVPAARFQDGRGRAVPESERHQREVGGDQITHRAKQMASLELVGAVLTLTRVEVLASRL
jgi:hypothetical protein